jgi:ATP-binding protein involved in chromosome partitioning
MPTNEEVRAVLRNVLDPEIGKPIEDVGMLKDIRIEGDTVTVTVLLTIEGCPLRERIETDVTAAVAPLAGVGHVQVVLGTMSEDERGELVTKLRGGRPEQPQFFTDGKTTVIAVASGKGGVGKSSVTVNLACALAAQGHRVGVLDVDVWGFSVPRMMGVSGQKLTGYDSIAYPVQSHGVKLISMGFVVEEETPVIWRGPMLHKAVQQFLGDVYWGELDFLLADLPPGTGDVSISMAGFLPGAQLLVVTTPQEAARKVAERAGKMAGQVRQTVVGVVENMSYFVCPHCGERTNVFGEGGGRLAADTLGVPLLGQIPLMPELREGGDAGTPIVVSHPDSAAGQALLQTADALATASRTRVRKPLRLMATQGAAAGNGHAGNGHEGHQHAQEAHEHAHEAHEHAHHEH